jgi:hypothetical protein
MAFEHKPGTFSLFKNAKDGNEKRPDYRGEGKDMQGNDIEVAAWLKDGPKGKYMSCTFKPKEAHQEPQRQAPQRGGSIDELDSDIPF